MLKTDHTAVIRLFSDYEKAPSNIEKKALVAEICTALSVHTLIEEEIFYPAFGAVLKDKPLVLEANLEHASVQKLIAQLDGLEPDGEKYDALIKALSDHVSRHFMEEENGMFPRAMESTMDLVELGARMATRKAALLSGFQAGVIATNNPALIALTPPGRPSQAHQRAPS
jgi:iron-sulfur cluster repair protein YtfE (RIC family)